MRVDTSGKNEDEIAFEWETFLMPNVATLGLEFTSGDAGSQIEALCKKFDALEKKCGSAQTALNELANGGCKKIVESIGSALAALRPVDSGAISSIRDLASGLKGLKSIDPEAGRNLGTLFSSLNGLPTVDNRAVTQIAAVAGAMKSLHGIDPGIAGNITAIVHAVSGIRPIPPDIATGIAAFANGLKGVTVSGETTASFAGISAMMASLRPIDSAVSASLRQFIADVNGISPVKPEIARSIQDLFSSAGAVKLDGDVNRQVGELAKTLSGLKVVKPEIAVSIRDIFDSFKSAQTIPPDAVESIAKLGVATGQFKVIRPAVVASMEKLMSLLRGLPDVDAGKTEAMRRIAEATALFKVIRPQVTQSIRELFTRLEAVKRIPTDVSGSISAMSSALAGFKAVNKRVVESVKSLFAAIASFKPIPESALGSIRTLTDLFNSMSSAGTRAAASSKNLAGSVGMLGTQADSTAMAFRGLQGAFSVQYIERATAAAVEFGKELAYIQTLSASMNVEQLGAGLMNFSAMLGEPAENANALYKAYSAGIRGTEEEFLKFTEIASKTAQVNRSSLLPMVDAMTAAMNAYGMSIRDTSELADNFFAIVKYGKASGEQLANSFGQVSPTAKTLGVTLDELGASIASLTKVQPTRVAITGLNNMLSKIMKPTKESRLALEKLGVDMSYSAVQSKGFVTVLREVHTALNGNMEALKNIFPDIRGQRAAMHLLGAGWSDFNQQLDNFANKKGSMEAAFAVLENDADVQLGRLPVTLNKITTEAGNMVVSLLTLDGALTPLIASFNSMEEGPRKAFAAITLLVAGYGTYKAALMAINTYRAIEMRNNQILGAQTAASIQAVHHSTAAHYRLVRAKASAAAASAALAKTQAAAANQFALEQSLMVAEIEYQIAYAKSIGNTTAVLALELQLKKQLVAAGAADTAALTAETTAIRAEAAARALNTKAIAAENMAKAAGGATGTLSMIGRVAGTGQGFKAGFSAMAGTAEFLSSVKDFKASFKGIGSAMSLVTKIGDALKVAWTGLGAVMGKIVAILTSATAIVTGIVAIVAVGIDYLQSFIRTGKAWGEGSKSVTQTIMNGVVDWWTGASKTAKQQDENLAKIYEMINAKKALRDLGQRLQERFDHLFDDLKDRGKSKPQQFADTAKAYNEALAKYQSQFGKAQVEAAFASADAAQKELIQVNTRLLAGGKKREDLADEEKQALEAAERKAKAAVDKANKMNEDATALQDALHSYGVKLYDMASAQKAALTAVRELEDAQNYKMMSPDQQIAENRRQYKANYSAYISALQKGDAEAAKKSFQALIGNYNTIRDAAMKKIADNKKTMENLQKMQMDAMLQLAPTDAGKFAIYQQEQQRMQQEAMNKAAAGDYAGAQQAWQKSAEAARQMISMQNKLAQAEMNANDSTRKMILQLDKFKSHAAGVVDAYSVKAVELQSRRFDNLPAMNNSTTMQSTADQLNQQLAQQTLQFVQQMQGKLASDSKDAQDEQDKYDKLWKSITDGNKQNLQGIESSMAQILSQLSNGIKVTMTKGFEIKSVRI